MIMDARERKLLGIDLPFSSVPNLPGKKARKERAGEPASDQNAKEERLGYF
jgi:hypothetical protein